MKIVQSFWSKPHSDALINVWESRSHGGWLDDKYHYMSWALSSYQLRKYYDEVELVTDAAGKELLIDILNLPYTNVVVKLDEINDYDRDLWALGKVYTYSLQQSPFLHVDGDIFIWKPFEKKLLESGLIAQHLEVGHSYYKKVMKMVDMHISYVPQSVKNYRSSHSGIDAFNMGLFGGNDIDFINNYTRESFNFVNLNLDILDNIPKGPFNTIYEQVLFLSMAKKYNKEVNLFTQTTGEKFVNKELNSLSNFRKAPGQVDLVHLFGCNKKKIMYCTELSSKLKSSCPDYYERIMDLVSVGVY